MNIDINSLMGITCIDVCDGVCKRVLKDIEKSEHSTEKLMEAYLNDKLHGGRDYQSIIKLGKLLSEIAR